MISNRFSFCWAAFEEFLSLSSGRVGLGWVGLAMRMRIGGKVMMFLVDDVFCRILFVDFV